MARPSGVMSRRFAVSLLLIALVAAPAAAAAQGRWVGTWATGPLALDPPAAEARAGRPVSGTPYRLGRAGSRRRLFEHACHEGSYGMTNLPAGARVQERRAEEASGGAAR